MRLLQYYLLSALHSRVTLSAEHGLLNYITDSGNIKSVQFKSGNKATFNLPSASGDKEERNCDYEIKGKEIYLAAEGETVKAFEIKGDSLIVYGITNLDGSIVLKKK